MNILVVEDEEDVCLAMVDRLRDLRNHANDVIYPTFSAAPALELLRQHPIELLITDIRLPGEDGLKLIERARKLRPSLKSIVMTAYEDFSYAQTALRLGCSDFLLKPFSRQALREAIDRAFQTPDSSATEDDVLKPDWVRAYVREHYSEPLEMNAIADMLHISYAYFSRRFKEIMGQNFSDYVQEVRLDEACRMLKAGKNVGIVAEKVGYANIYSFTRAFTRMKGCSPTQWLKELESEKEDTPND